MEENAPTSDRSDEKITRLQEEVSLLREQVAMLFELSLSATETLQAAVQGRTIESERRLQHLVSGLRPLAETLDGESNA